MAVQGATFAVVLFVLAMIPSVAFAALPHGGYGATTRLCENCHKVHQSKTSKYLFSVDATSGSSGEIAACYSCHDGSGSNTNVKTGTQNSFALSSGHRVENVTETAGCSYDLTNRCSACHSPHSGYAASRRLPVRSVVTSSGTYTVTGANNTWCYACHNDSNDWYKSTTSTVYPAMSSPTRDASGYPVTGTYPGKTTYSDVAKNRHAVIPSGITTDPMLPSQTTTRVAGDCLWCHSAHRGQSKYDSLPTTFTAPATTTVSADRTRGDYAAACFTCHGGGSWEASGAVNIKRYAVKTPDDTSTTSGHRIKTTGATLPLNSPLPCYECHNPHGSTRNNKMLLADTLGQNLDATVSAGVVITPAVNVRRFCFTCHSTSDVTPRVWDSVAGAYTNATPSMMYQGLRRDGTLLAGQTRPSGYSLNENYLSLKPLGGSDHHSESSTKSCYDCHGKSYLTATAQNVHAPSMGISPGGVACYGCHSEYQPMEDNIGTTVGGAARLTSYHHVLGSASNEGDFAPATSSTYPTSSTDVYCVSCHTDHDQFNSNKGANLRSNIVSPTVITTNTDFIAPGATGSPGICVSCHRVGLTKQNADQASSGTTTTVSINATGYAASAHRYSVVSTFGSSPFRADCAKCHNDTLAKTWQTNPTSLNAFGVHTSSESRILAALGGTLANPYEEQFCYKCHSRASESQGSTWTATFMRDRYGVASMSATSVAIYGQVTKTYGHKVGSYAGKHKASASDETRAYLSANKHVECADCHGVHDAAKGTHIKGTNVASPALYGAPGVAWSAAPASEWTTVALNPVTVGSTYAEFNICLRCHSGYNTALATWDDASTDTWTDVALEFNTKNDSYHPVFGALPATDLGSNNGSSRLPNDNRLGGQWTAGRGATMYCSDCHGDSVASAPAQGPHGSAVDHLLKGPNTTWPGTNGQYYLGGDLSDLFCLNCHPNLNDTAQTNGVHSRGSHRGSFTNGGCTRCHLKLPHGGKISRLLVDADSAQTPTRYKGYMASIYSFRKDSASTYNNASTWCYASCQHTSAQNYEDWED